MADGVMTSDVIVFRMDGTASRRGRVLADVMIAKFGRFVQTIARLERTFLNKPVKQTDFEIANLTKRNPSEIWLSPVPRVKNYSPENAILWSFSQIDRLSQGQTIDNLVNPDTLDDIIELTNHQAIDDFNLFEVSYRQFRIALDENLNTRANLAKASLFDESRNPWRSGISVGHLTGELRSVLDANDEHTFLLCSLTGAQQVKCVFSEELRQELGKALFKGVRVSGLLHYDGSGPFPYLVEASRLELLDESESAPHFLDARGLFTESIYSINNLE